MVKEHTTRSRDHVFSDGRLLGDGAPSHPELASQSPLLSGSRQPLVGKLFKVREPYFCSQIIGCILLIFKGMESFTTNVNNLCQAFPALISVPFETERLLETHDSFNAL